MRPFAFYLFVCLVLGNTRPPLTNCSSVTLKFCRHGWHQIDLHIPGFNFKCLWWRGQNWNTSTMCCLMPGAQLLVMEIEFPQVWMGNQWFYHWWKEGKKSPDCTNVTPHWAQTPNFPTVGSIKIVLFKEKVWVTHPLFIDSAHTCTCVYQSATRVCEALTRCASWSQCSVNTVSLLRKVS